VDQALKKGANPMDRKVGEFEPVRIGPANLKGGIPERGSKRPNGVALERTYAVSVPRDVPSSAL